MTQPTSHRATRENGPPVVGGKLIWTSATGITSADPNSYGGCLRKWWYDQVAGEKEPATKAMEAGTELHTEVENRLRLGQPLQTPLALAGSMFIPQPGDNLSIERPIHFTTAGGIGIFGHVDLYNFRQEYIDPEGDLQRDPPWSFEVKDWKTTADFQYAKTERELGENIQLITYAEAGFRFAPDMEHARLTHVYFRTRGRPEARLVTIRRTREEISSRWQYSESVVRLMVDAAREPTAETVPGVRKACDAYRGCPHRAKCSIYTFNALDTLYGKIVTDHQEQKMGLLANTLQQPAPTAAAPAAPSMQQQLAQEEATMRLQVAQQQQVTQQPVQLADICHRLGSYGYGFPSLAGNAAQAYAAIGGQQVAPGFVFHGITAPPGSRRSLHSIQLTEVGHIYQLESELAAERGAAPPVQQYVPQMPAAPPVQQYTAPAMPAQPSFLPPGAPESIPALASLPPKTPVDPAAPVEAAPAKKRGRPAKAALDAAPEATAAVEAPPPPAPAALVPPVATSSTPVEAPAVSAAKGTVLINARGLAPTKSLAGYVDYINGELSKRYSVTSDGKPGIQDVRCVPKDSPLAYGGWKGAVREIVKADPPPVADYHLDTFTDELNEVVADALRVVAEREGWLYFRGVR